MQISPPFGYKQVVPFQKTHKVRLLAPGEAPQFVREGAAVPISHSEFVPAGRHYPIVFIGDGRNFNAVAVVGMSTKENLFISDGKWTSEAYMPAYARRYPFCMAKVNVNRVEQKNRLICIEQSAIDEKGEAMFDAKGQPTDKWQALEKLLSEYEADQVELVNASGDAYAVATTERRLSEGAKA